MELSKLVLVGSVLVASFCDAQSKNGSQTKKKIDLDTSISTAKDTTKVEEQKKLAASENGKLPKPYNAKADAEKDILESIAKAKADGKNIILQAGGNWCIWCLRFNQFVQTTPDLKKIVDDNFVYYHLNYSPDNKNEKIFAKYGNPGDKLGYPVFIILNSDGEMIHVQESSILEQEKGYSLEKTKKFFEDWISKK